MLDDIAYVSKLYADNKPMRDGVTVSAPRKPKLKWWFHDLEFGLLDEATEVFFCISPFFKR